MSMVCFYGQFISLFWYLGVVLLRGINTPENNKKSAEIYGKFVARELGSNQRHTDYQWPPENCKKFIHAFATPQNLRVLACVAVYPLCSKISPCSFCVAKNLHYRVARCVKNIQKTEAVKHDLRNILMQ